jgi:hypothetical protein
LDALKTVSQRADGGGVDASSERFGACLSGDELT